MRSSMLLFFYVQATLHVVAYSQDGVPSSFKSQAVRDAIQSFDDSIHALRMEFSEAVGKLTEKYNSDMNKRKSEQLFKMQSLLKQKTQSADLDEAIKIRDLIKVYQDSKFEFLDTEKPAAICAAKVIELEKQIAALTQTKAKRVTPQSRQSLVGTWRWFDGGDVVFEANGEAEGGLKGTWRSIEGSKNSFSATWSNGSTDSLKMSDDGKLLEGNASLNGMRVWAVRLK